MNYYQIALPELGFHPEQYFLVEEWGRFIFVDSTGTVWLSEEEPKQGAIFVEIPDAWVWNLSAIPHDATSSRFRYLCSIPSPPTWCRDTYLELVE